MAGAADVTERVGVVVIGRNEGERLVRSLRSVLGRGAPVAYADSGSSDGSVERARGLGAEAVVLDASKPMSAGRGRNEGFARLREIEPGLEFVQFVDGDTEIESGWLEAASRRFGDDAKLAIVCGRLRERDREKSVYARLCDIDWHGPVGPIRACGGIFMVRASAFAAVGGFNPGVVTGEEAELCRRLTQAGWTLERIDALMGQHDANMQGFRDWWKRTERVGHGYAKAAFRRDEARDESKKRRVMSSVLWGAVLPMVAAAGAVGAWWVRPMMWVPVAVVLMYVLMAAKIARWMKSCGRSWGDSWLWGVFCLIAKWPQLCGHVRYWVRG